MCFFIEKGNDINNMERIKEYLFGFFIGFINGFFGSAGGIIAVELLKRKGLEQKKAQATSIAVIVIISLVSAFIYFSSGKVNVSMSYKYVLGGFFGAILGAIFLKKLSNKFLKRVFGIIIIFCGIRLLIK